MNGPVDVAVDDRTRRRWRLAVTATVALSFYSYAWLVQPLRPQLAGVFDEPPALVAVTPDGFRAEDEAKPLTAYQTKRWGWYGTWYDQFHYARMARALGRLQLPGLHWDHVAMRAEPGAPEKEPSSFSYGLGYPLLGAVFFVLGFRGDPFVVLNGLLFAATACLALILAERVVRPWTALIVVNVLVLTAPFVRYFVIPYSTSLTAVAILTCLVVVTGDRFSWRVAVPTAVLVAFAFAARYVDAVWVVGLLSPILLLRWRQAWRVLAAMAVGLIATAGVVAVAQDVVFGSPFKTPYHYVHGGLDASLEAYQLDQIPGSSRWGGERGLS